MIIINSESCSIGFVIIIRNGYQCSAFCGPFPGFLSSGVLWKHPNNFVLNFYLNLHARLTMHRSWIQSVAVCGQVYHLNSYVILDSSCKSKVKWAIFPSKYPPRIFTLSKLTLQLCIGVNVWSLKKVFNLWTCYTLYMEGMYGKIPEQNHLYRHWTEYVQSQWNKITTLKCAYIQHANYSRWKIFLNAQLSKFSKLWKWINCWTSNLNRYFQLFCFLPHHPFKVQCKPDVFQTAIRHFWICFSLT